MLVRTLFPLIRSVKCFNNYTKIVFVVGMKASSKLFPVRPRDCHMLSVLFQEVMVPTDMIGPNKPK